MRKRWLLGIVLVIVGFMAVAVTFPATVYGPMGLLRHEAFFAGKPTNYWSRAIKQEGFLGHQPPEGDIGKTLRDGGSAAVPVLRDLAENPDDRVRSEALLALSLIGPEAKDATPTLTATIAKEANSTRFLMASEALGKVDTAAAAKALAGVIGDKTEANFGRRSWALTALLKLAPDGHEAQPVVKGLLQDPAEDARLRVQAVEVLWYQKQPAEPLVPALCAFASADKGVASVQALTVLGEMGPAAKSAIPALLKLLDQPALPVTGNRWGPAHRAAVVRTLGKLSPDAGVWVPVLVALLKNHKYLALHAEAAQALGAMGPRAKEAVPALLGMLQSGEPVWWMSITLLAGQPPAHVAAVPLVHMALKQKPPSRDAQQTDRAVRTALLQIDPDAAARVGVH